MGCNCSGKEIDIYEQSFSDFEQSFLFYNYSPVEIDRCFYRYSFRGLLHRQQFETACRELKISYEKFEYFFNFFLEEKRYQASKLSTLGLLLSSGSIESKASVLFDNYDEDLSGVLAQNEMRRMLNDIFSISCYLVPDFVRINNYRNKDLASYCLKLKVSVNYLNCMYLDELMFGEKQMTRVDFIQKRSGLLERILNSKKSRKMCIEAYNKNIRPLEEKIRFFDNSFLNSNIGVKKYCDMKIAEMNSKNEKKLNSIKSS